MGEQVGYKFNVGQLVRIGKSVSSLDEYEGAVARVMKRQPLVTTHLDWLVYQLRLVESGEVLWAWIEESCLSRHVESGSMTPFDQFKNKYKLNGGGVLLFPFGSRVYGTHSEQSDYDFMAVVPKGHDLKTGEELRSRDFNVHVYTRDDFQDQLNAHKIHTLEAYFLSDGRCKKEFKWKLDLKTLRHELSAKASNSWVKAKKKMEVENDLTLGRKSLFHALRILTFGIQIARDGKITDYSAANPHWEAIKGEFESWPEYQTKYQPVYNALGSEFREVAPK